MAIKSDPVGPDKGYITKKKGGYTGKRGPGGRVQTNHYFFNLKLLREKQVTDELKAVYDAIQDDETSPECTSCTQAEPAPRPLGAGGAPPEGKSCTQVGQEVHPAGGSSCPLIEEP